MSYFRGSLPTLASSLACLEATQDHVGPLGYPDPKEEMELTLVLVQPNLLDIPETSVLKGQLEGQLRDPVTPRQ